MAQDSKDARIAELEAQLQEKNRENAKLNDRIDKLNDKIKEKNRKLNTIRQKASRASKKKTPPMDSSNWDAVLEAIEALRITNMTKGSSGRH